METYYRRVGLALCVAIAVLLAAGAGILNATAADASPISEAKSAQDNTPCDVQSAIVSAAFDGFFYIEADDRSSGIRVHAEGHSLQAGMRANVTGTVQTSPTGEHFIQADTATANGTGSVAPLAMPVRSLWTGLDTAGLLVRVSGRITSRDTQSGSFILDDGSGIDNNGATECVPVTARVDANGMDIPVPGSFVTVTGISSREVAGGVVTHVLLPREQADIQVIKIGPPEVTISDPSVEITAAGPVTYTITYDGASGITLSAGGVVLNKTGTADGIVSVSGDGPTRTVTISDTTGDGTLSISLAAGTAVNAEGNPALATGPSASFDVVNAPLSVSISAPSVSAADYWPVSYTITYSGAANVSLRASDVILSETGTARGTVSVSGSGRTTRTVTISRLMGDGTIGLSIAPGTGTDPAGNPVGGAGPSAAFAVTCGPADRGSWPMLYGNRARNNSSMAIGPATPVKKWEFAPGSASVRDASAIAPDGTVYVVLGGHGLCSINPDGTQKWQYYGLFESPSLGADGTVYAPHWASGPRLYALNPDGTKKWEAAPTVQPCYSVGIGADGTIYAGSYEAYSLCALGADGIQQWAFSAARPCVSPPAVGPDGTIYATSNAAIIALPDTGYLYAVNPNGTLKWQLDDCRSPAPAIGADGTMYVRSFFGKLYAVNPNGAKKWEFVTNGSALSGRQNQSSPAIGPDGTIYAGSSSNTLYAIDRDGTEKWEVTFFAFPYALTGGDGTIYVGADKLYALNPDGTQKWAFGIGGAVSSALSMGPDGTLYVTSGNRLIAVGPGSGARASISTPSAAATASDPVSYTVTYTGAASIDLRPEDIVLNKTGTADGTVSVSGDANETRTVTISGITGDGTLGISIAGYSAFDGAGNPALPAGPSATFCVANTPPGVSIGPPSVASSGFSPVSFVVSYAGAASISLSASDVTLNTTGTAGGVVYVSGSGNAARTVTIYDLTGEGTIGISLAAGTAANIAGLTAPAAGPSATAVVSCSAMNRLPWPTFGRDPMHSGRCRATGPDSPSKLWQVSIQVVLAGVRCSPVIGRDWTIYVPAGDKKLRAVNPDGTIKWTFDTGSTQYGVGVGIDGTVYLSSGGTLYAIDPDGTEKWDLAGVASNSSPVVAPDGTVYIASDKLYAVNPDGTKKWECAVGSFAGCAPAIGIDGTIYVGRSGAGLCAVSPEGTIKWQFAAAGGGSYSPAVAPDGTIYYGSTSFRLYAINPDGTEKWEFATSNTGQSSPAIGPDGTIYVSSGRLYAIAPNGTKKWEFSSGTYTTTPVVDAAGTVYFTASRLYAFNPDGTEKWQYIPGAHKLTSPAMGADGTIYVMGADAALHAIGPGGGPNVGVSIGTPSTDATDNGPVSYAVTYTNAASVYLQPADVVLNKTGTADGIISVSGDGNTTRTVTISNTTGDGILAISLHGGTAFDSAGNPCAPAGPSATFDVTEAPPAPYATFTTSRPRMRSISVTKRVVASTL